MEKDIPLIAFFISVASLALFFLIRTVRANTPPKIYFHIKHDDSGYPNTIGKIHQIYDIIKAANKTGYNIGLVPQSGSDWDKQLDYLSETDNIPIMLNVFTSDDNIQLSTEQILQATNVSSVQYFRFHEVCSSYDPLPIDYIKSILALARQMNIPIFWNEWNTNCYDTIADIIQGYEDLVTVSFGTNNNWLEPTEGYQLLQRFQRRGASVQSWYWWERNDRQPGYEYTMPPELMAQHTQEAFQAGAEVVQYEPFGYFFNNEVPKSTLAAVLA